MLEVYGFYPRSFAPGDCAVKWRARLRKAGLKPEYVREYPYVNDEMSLCFVKTRFNLIDIESGEVKGKTFLVHSYPSPIRQGQEFDPVADRKDGLLPKYRGLVYRQPDVRDALYFDRPVYVCEGEKDVEYAAAAYGDAEQAFTSMYQGGEPMHELQAHVFAAGASRSALRFVMDRDKIGPYVAYSNALEINRAGVKSRRIEFYYPKVKANKSDLADHVEAGFTLEDLVRVPADTVRAAAAETAARIRAGGISKRERSAMGSEQWENYGFDRTEWLDNVARASAAGRPVKLSRRKGRLGIVA